MITANKELMAQARTSLEGNWGKAIGVAAIYLLLTVGVSNCPPSYTYSTYSALQGTSVNLTFGSVITLLIAGPLALGLYSFFLGLSRGEEVGIELLFDGFKQFAKAFIASILMGIFTFLWMLLLIIPGIIAALSYSQTWFIIRENPEIGAYDAIQLSKQMMNGYKWKYFCLCCRFIGWILLCLFTFGIGYLLLAPYIYTSHAKFYDDLKANQA
jgi:uncharacterized membrane protein